MVWFVFSTVSREFPKEEQQQEKGAEDKDPFLIAVKITEEQGAVLVAVVSEPGEDCIPQQDAQGRTEEVAAKGLFHGSCHKTDVGPAQGNDTAQKDSAFPMVAEGAVRGKDGALQRGEPSHGPLQQGGTARSSDTVGEGGASQSGGAADQYENGIGHAAASAYQPGKGKYDLTGDRKTGVLQKDQSEHGGKPIVC